MKRAFTLIELVVVLAIMALLTHLAVREAGSLRRDRLRAAADGQLETIRDAVWKDGDCGEPTGFLVDMGRLPRAQAATNESGLAVATLSELWRRPAGVPEFALRHASATNLVVSEELRGRLADTSVCVPCGWRGPYLRMPFGRDRLLDPWGNPVETPDDAGFSRLMSPGGAAAAADALVGRVAHFGADARPDESVEPPDDAARDAAAGLLPPGGLSNPLVVTAAFMDGDGPRIPAGAVECRWYMPCGGAITGDVATAEASSTAFRTFEFEGLPPGVCTLVVRESGVNRAVERVVVPPGGRQLDVKVRLP